MHWRWLQVTLIGLLAALLVPMPLARAHEVRPAYLQIDEVEPGRYQLLWRTPVLAGMRLPVVLRLPDEIHDVIEPAAQELSDSLVERHLFDAGTQGLAGRRIEFVGLQATVTDCMVRVQMLDGTHSTTLVRPSQPWVDIATSQGALAVAGAYLSHGIEHILFGFDHLLFVLGLILIVRNTRMLLLTVTGFTVAHSITLSLATLGVLHVPGPPVEACIALSILLLARPRLRQRADRYRSSTRRHPACPVHIQHRGGDRAVGLHRLRAQRAGLRQALQPSVDGRAPRAGGRDLCDRKCGSVLVHRATGRICDLRYRPSLGRPILHSAG